MRLSTVLLVFGCSLGSYATVPVPMDLGGAARKQATLSSLFVTANNASVADISAAHQIVEDALKEDARVNLARIQHPARNHFQLKPGSKVAKRKSAPPTLQRITPEIATAAALLSTLDSNDTTGWKQSNRKKRASSFWMETLQRKGSVAFGDGHDSYKVFRNVVDYGADPTGGTDSTKAIQDAIADGKRCGEKCNGSTTKNAIVYFPAGTYKVAYSISVYFGTQIIGDANNWPTLVASKFHIGLGVLSTDVYVPQGGSGPDGNSLEWYINTARFYSQIRNLKIDVRDVRKGSHKAALHYQVAQATTLENIEILADSATDQQGIFAENGSGGVMSDITIIGGNYGIYGGSQQFSASRMTFKGCNTAVQLIWDWGWVWKKIFITGGKVGFALWNDAAPAELPGSLTVVDSTIEASDAAISMAAPADGKDKGFTGLVLDNVKLSAPIKDRDSAKEIVAAKYHKHYVIGATYKEDKRTWKNEDTDYTREPTLLGDSWGGLDVSPYFDRRRNQYETLSASSFIHVKDLGAKGDGVTDDTAALQKAFNDNAGDNKVIFVDAGTYIITNTVTVPNGARIVGETWSQLAAKGGKFGDAKNPTVMLKVGNDGDVGSVELQDLILTTIGPTPGAVLMEWNIQAKDPGSAALWDVHVRLGGATGTELTPDECPPTVGLDSPKCQAASMMMHVTSKASGYFDNMWLWVADHMIDDPLPDDANNNMTQVTVFSARGMLIESQKATWLYGTASEHSVFYQYNFRSARNIYTTYLQTESAYYQPSPAPPAPFKDAVGKYSGDPNYDCKGGPEAGCDESWAVMMTQSENIHIGAAGTYSWFHSYSQECVDGRKCQKSLWFVDDNFDNNRLEQIISIGAENIFVHANGAAIKADDNTAVTKHPVWSHVSVYEVGSKGPAPSNGQCDLHYTWPDSPAFRLQNIDNLYGHTHSGTELSRNGSDYDLDALITIVNLTPYTLVFRKDLEPEPYQMTGHFEDIGPGRASTLNVSYHQSSDINPVDSNGYFRYLLNGTNKYFRIKATTHVNEYYDQRIRFIMQDGMGKADKEFPIPGELMPTTLVITGSEDYGDYYVSTSFADYNWMKMIKPVIQDRQLRHVVVPGSHDAGMTGISSAWRGGGTEPNTQTQSLDIYNQLRTGVRYFDMRIVSVSHGDFYAAHMNEERKMEKRPFGATGASLQELIDGTNRFTTDYPGEVIIWWIRSLIDIVNGTAVDYWAESKVKEFMDKLTTINNRCINLNPDFGNQTMGSFMDMNDGKGCVLLVTQQTADDPNRPELFIEPSLGIYNGTYLGRRDYWANAVGSRDVDPKEIDENNSLTRASNETKADTYFIMQWQTTNGLDGLQESAVVEANPSLYGYGVDKFTPTHFPTVFLTDAVGLTTMANTSEADYNARAQILAIGLNLYLTSYNCNITKVRHPFQPKA